MLSSESTLFIKKGKTKKKKKRGKTILDSDTIQIQGFTFALSSFIIQFGCFWLNTVYWCLATRIDLNRSDIVEAVWPY